MAEKCLCDELTLLMKLLLEIGNNSEACQKYGLKPREAKLLPMIYRFPHEALTFYSENLMMENGSFAYLIKKLFQNGYIEIIDSEIDKRSREIVLTTRGVSVAKDIISSIEEHIDYKLSKLSSFEKNKLLDAFDTISYSFQRIAGMDIEEN
ncbi:MAG: MarR family winged helix-turn-helix transcriptional regulator [Candidatus Izemoplasmatales bacterium]